MSNKNKSKKPNASSPDVDNGRRKVVKGSPAKEEIIGKREEEPRGTSKPVTATISTPVQKPRDTPVAKPKVEETPWSEWNWDEVSGQWYRARLGPDKTWQYDFPEPLPPVLPPSPVPQFAPAKKFQYSEPEARVIFANEVVYQIPDSKGGYLLAVRQDKTIWNVEETSSSTKSKEAPKKADNDTEKKDGSVVKATPSSADSQKPFAGEKAPVKAGAEAMDIKPAGVDSSPKKTVGLERVHEWRVQVNDAAQKEVNGSAPEPTKKQLPEINKESKQSVKPKKAIYIESDEDEPPRHRGRQRERRR
ncbi:hypothetical protein ONS95_000751 [Cadophora gregata]|uniref:uncharacterized protein n=1 Tax=Cadophora gregata TaxID=51156 RepID=UPI0026DC8A6B|nr:uncharacterized protein ONS95_000751 [Cadophora gregata]KAK0103072.1 hypothetical protein ONS96_005683 [Cadophora gregata f. sp. sojae]KAK0128801.1 hypothetical protein ONS95_000751 [Cadophora gregata]